MITETTLHTSDDAQPIFDFRTYEAFERYTRDWASRIIDYAKADCYSRDERRRVTKRFKRAVTLYLRSVKPTFPQPGQDTPNALIVSTNQFLVDLHAAAEKIRMDGPF
jgi:hypothetical protein